MYPGYPPPWRTTLSRLLLMMVTTTMAKASTRTSHPAGLASGENQVNSSSGIAASHDLSRKSPVLRQGNDAYPERYPLELQITGK
jgi:hypothetical protein